MLTNGRLGLRAIRMVTVAGVVMGVASASASAITEHQGHASRAARSPTRASGTSWRVIPSIGFDCRKWHAAVPSTTKLRAVAATGPGDAWAVGTCGPAGTLSEEEGGTPVGVIEHWNGKRWHQVPVPRSESYETVTAISDHDAWAGGDTGPVIRWDGRRWARADQGLPSDLLHVRKVSATSSSNVWTMVGSGYAEQVSLHRWDGDRWREVKAPVGCAFPFDGDYGELAAGWNDDVWTDDVVCQDDRPTVWHYDGRGWTALRMPSTGWRSLAGSINVIGRDVWVTVDESDPSRLDGRTMLYRLTATAWMPVPDPYGDVTSGPMSGDGHGGLWLLGGPVENPGHGTRLQHWDGRRWTPQRLPVPPGGRAVNMNALAQVPGTSTVWVVGSDDSDNGRPLIEVTEAPERS